ncbi:hypothetical protein D9M71_482400 [compost metagenome]
MAPGLAGAATGAAAGAAAAGAAAAGAGALGAAAAGAVAATGAAGAAPLTFSFRIRSPVPTSSSSLMETLSTTPAAGDGISMLALSDSRVISDWSATTVSPALTRTSMILALPAEPMSGTWMSWTLSATGAAGAAAGAGAAAAAGAAAWAGAAAAGAAAPATSRSRIRSPVPTSSLSLTLMALTTPAAGDGISMLALSDSRVISD